QGMENVVKAQACFAALARQGHACLKSRFDSGGDSGAGDDDMDAYMAGGEGGAGGQGGAGGKAGRTISATSASVIRQAIEHGKAIKKHASATPGHKSMAKTA